MEIDTRSEEVYPVYYENDDDREWAIRQTIDVDPRLWIDYKMARDKFLKLKIKMEKEIRDEY